MASDNPRYDYVVLGGGIFGVYAVNVLLNKGLKVALIDADGGLFSRASYINQARVHMGYHYPRSIQTAHGALQYFERFVADYETAIKKNFKKIYAISNRNSYTACRQFKRFCQYLNIPCVEVDPETYFNKGMVEGAFETIEYAFDASKILNVLFSAIKEKPGFSLLLGERPCSVQVEGDMYRLVLNSGKQIVAPAVLNATYAGINQVLRLFDKTMFKIKYEISEIILCNPNNQLKDLGITVMDGQFFSTMPFGFTGLHTLTAVEFTPHRTCHVDLPEFPCQNTENKCTPYELKNCNLCVSQPRTAFPYMHQIKKKYLLDKYDLQHVRSCFAVKAILRSSEIDDGRPTLVVTLNQRPKLISVLSGKVNTIYDLEEVLA